MKTFNTIADIKTEREQQRSNSVIYSLLGVVLGELDRLPIPRSQEPSEDQIYSVLKKLYLSAKGNTEYRPTEESKAEYEYLKDYIKQPLTEDEINTVIDGQIADGNNTLNGIMKHFKMKYPNLFDGAEVAKMIRTKLK